jgi:hypothetical protein
MTTLNEAARCPICNEPGHQYAVKPSGNPGNKVLMYRCTNSQCRWGSDPEDLGWIVEVDQTGNIPERTAADKQFEPLHVDPAVIERAQQAAKAYAKPVQDLKKTPEVGPG